MLAKVTVVKIANYGTSVCGAVAAATSPHTTHSNALPDDGVTAPKHVGAVLMSILSLRQFTVHQLVNKNRISINKLIIYA